MGLPNSHFSTVKRPEKAEFYERIDNETLVERAGYIPTKQRIEEFINAGKRLSDYRKEKYHFAPGQKIDENFVDPTTNPGYDFAQAKEDLAIAQANLKAQQEAFDAKNNLQKQDAVPQPGPVDPGPDPGNTDKDTTP